MFHFSQFFVLCGIQFRPFWQWDDHVYSIIMMICHITGSARCTHHLISHFCIKIKWCRVYFADVFRDHDQDHHTMKKSTQPKVCKTYIYLSNRAVTYQRISTTNGKRIRFLPTRPNASTISFWPLYMRYRSSESEKN